MRRLGAGRWRKALGDVRVLGWGAPLRAGYEASKRLGGHAVVFRTSTPSAVPPMRSGLFPVPEIPLAVRERTFAAADRIVTGEVEIFGRLLPLGMPPDWCAVIHKAGRWPDSAWWLLDLRSDARLGDVKWAWELGRHRHLVLLARAAHLDPGDARYRSALEGLLRSWLSANQPERGVHWYSSLEIALRSVAWLQILDLAGTWLSPATVAGMHHHLYQGGRHIVRDLPHTVSTMRNNHLLGDALGLVALGTAFEGTVASRWKHWGEKLFAKQVRRMVRPDGSMIEDSVSYHRFVLEMLAARMILGEESAAIHAALSEGAQFLARLGALVGPVPQYGDWDGARVFAVASDPETLAGSVRLALALAGEGAPAPWREEHDEIAWHISEGVPVEPEQPEAQGRDIGGGIARAERGHFVVWLKAGSGPSHGHADLLSVAVSHRGRLITADPGTGAYNGPLAERNELRSSQAHNVVRVEGRDQLEPHRVFRWRYRASGRVGNPIVHEGSTLMWGCHNAFQRLDPGRRVVRVVAVAENGVFVQDWIEGDPIALEGSIPLHPDVAWDPSGRILSVGDDEFGLLFPGEIETVASTWSLTYDHQLATLRLVWVLPSARRVAWAIDWPGLQPTVAHEQIHVEFGDAHATLAVPDAAKAVVWC